MTYTRENFLQSNNKENQVQPVKNTTREQNKAVSKQILDINTNAVPKNSLGNQEEKAQEISRDINHNDNYSDEYHSDKHLSDDDISVEELPLNQQLETKAIQDDKAARMNEKENLSVGHVNQSEVASSSSSSSEGATIDNEVVAKERDAEDKIESNDMQLTVQESSHIEVTEEILWSNTNSKISSDISKPHSLPSKNVSEISKEAVLVHQ
ncbi:7731_t:CDS:2 [Scutellospora calospora]|uniref:7731_t:CDS:1 n=1 Tax=Scutellospora calospora TaxID=85575 RepID=A0ACA9KM19_9GLOM|nr:7731_t:CDS:2 [Scutellospora calospora]